MMLSSISKIGSALMSKASSFSHANNFLAAVNPDTFVNRVVGFLGEIIYFVSKWILYIVDILFFYVQELCGLNIDTSSLQSMLDPNSDLLFRFLVANKNDILNVIRGLIGIGAIVIIVFTIIAIVRKQFQMMSEGKPQDIFESLKNGIKTILIMFLTPMFIIFSILASNVLLKTLYKITNVSGASSVGSQVFSSASSSANKYREYAITGERIPIVLDFSAQEEYLNLLNSNALNQEFIDFMNSKDSPIYRACTEFGQGKFTSFDKLNDMHYKGKSKETEVKSEVSSYYDAFDCLEHDNEYARIRAYQEEYLVMADVIDYAVKSSNTFYFMTVEQVYNSLKNYGKFDDNKIKSVFNSNKDIINGDLYNFTSTYYSIDENAEINGKTTIEYNHVSGTTDEIDGAVFIVAVEEKRTVGEEVLTYYTPLKNGYKGISDYEFQSDYLLNDSIVVAKGIFDEHSYPTAIRLSADGTRVQFYRDNLVNSIMGDSGDFATNTYVEEESSGGVISGFVKFLKSLFRPSELVPDLKISTDAMAQTYTKETTGVNRLENGKLHISYIFTDSVTSKLSGNMYGLKLYNLFEPVNLNYIVLVVGAIILFKVFFNSVLALIKRIYDIFLLTLIYPVAVATMPLYSSEKNSYKLWFETFVGKIYATYGLILGINFVLLLFPIINSISFFTMEEIATNTSIHRIGGVLFKFMSVGAITRNLNLLVAIVFELVAFTLLNGGNSSVSDIISKLVSPKQPNIAHPSESPIADIQKMALNATKTITKIGAFAMGISTGVYDLLTGKIWKKQFAKFIPGKEIGASIKDKAYLRKLKKNQKEKYRDLRESIDSITETDTSKISKDQKKMVEEKLKAFQEAQNNYSKALSDPRSTRKADETKKKKENMDQIMQQVSSREADDEEGGSTSVGDTRSKREIKKEGRKLKKLQHDLKKENRRLRFKRIRHFGFLSAADRNAIMSNKELIKQSKEQKDRNRDVLEGRKETKKELGETQKRIEELENRGALTEEEKKELEQAKTRAGELKNGLEKVKTAAKEKKIQEKEIEKQKKINRKELKKNRAFKASSRNFVASIQRRHILKDKQKGLKKQQAELTKILGKDVSKLTDNDLNALKLEQSISPEAVKQINAYQESKKRAEDLIQIREGKIEQEINKKTKKDEKFLSKRRFGFIRHVKGKIVNRSSKAKARERKQKKLLNKLNNESGQLDLLKQAKYKSKIKRLEQKVERSNIWKTNDTREGRRNLRIKRRNAKKQR